MIRHAEPTHEMRSDGTVADPPLTERGRTQARAVADWLGRRSIHHVLSSPALRARQTADATGASLGLAVQVDDRLRDANAAADHYVPLEAEKVQDPERYRARVEAYRESSQLAEISDRVCEALDEWTARCPGQRVAAFCHGSVVNVYASRVLGLESQAFLEAAYASAHRFMISSGGIRSVQSLNETAYLPD